MAQRVQKPRTQVQKNTRTEVIEDHQTRGETKRKALNEEIDQMVEEIDELLEKNAEEFVKSYVQKGGQ